MSCVKCEHLRPEHRDYICYGDRFCTCIKFEEAVEIIKNLVKRDPIQTSSTNGWLSDKRHFHNYKKEYGGTQKDMIDFYLGIGKEIDEIQDLLRCPRASIRGRMSELRNKY